MSTLPLSDVVDVTINVGPVAAVRTGFNMALIVGTSTHIPTATRVQTFTNLAGMTAAGWLGTEPEYLAAQIYFDQTPVPSSIAIGVWNNEPVLPIASPTTAPTVASSGSGSGLSAGTYYVGYSWLNTNYATGNQETIMSPIASVTITAGQTITTTLPALGTNANLANVYIGSATGQANMYLQGTTVTTTFVQSTILNTTGVLSPTSNTTTNGIAETAVQAVTACRQANSEWYACIFCNAIKSDILAIAAYIDSATPVSTFFYTTQDTDIIAGTAGNVMETLQSNKYHRTLGQYSTNVYSNNADTATGKDSVTAIVGYAMGSNTQTANSTYTLAYKPEVGVTPEPLTESQVTLIKGYCGNVYINRGSVYNVFENGTMADGTFFDEVLNLDILSNNIQSAVMNAFVDLPKVPQTDAGMAMLINAITIPLEKAVTTGFITPGTWLGSPILTVSTGDTLPAGYAILNGTIAAQSEVDKQNRVSPPIYILIKLAGAIQSIVIGLYINR